MRQLVLSVCAISPRKKSRRTFMCSPMEGKKAKLGGLQSLSSALLGRLLPRLWASSGRLRSARIFPGFVAHGCAREIIFQLREKKKKKRFLQPGLGNFTQDLRFKVRVGLPGRGRERSRARQIPCPRAGIPRGGVPTRPALPEQDGGCHLGLLQLPNFHLERGAGLGIRCNFAGSLPAPLGRRRRRRRGRGGTARRPPGGFAGVAKGS